MTLTRSKLTSNSKFLNDFLLSVKRNKKILIFISVMQLLGLPLMAVIGVSAAANDGFENSYAVPSMFLLISVFCFIAAVLCGIFLPLMIFSYLHKKSEVDMIYSLPIKRRTKFLSDCFSGLAIYTVPYIAACIIANLVLIIGFICIPELTQGLESVWNTFGIVIQLEFTGLLIMTMTYMLTVLVTCCCGNLLECIMNIFLVNGLIPGAVAVIAATCFSNLYGVSPMKTALPFFGYTNPGGGLFYIFYELDQADYYSGSSSAAHTPCLSALIYGKWVLFFLIFTAIYFLISFFLYQRRKAEDVSKPYVYKALYYIIVTVIMAAISLIARYVKNSLFPVIIFSFIVYMIFEVVTNRGFKKLHISVGKYIVTMLGILIINVSAIATHGFGAEGKIYPASMIKSVSVDYAGIDTVMKENGSIYHSYYYYDSDWESSSAKYTDKAIIKRILDIQKDAVSLCRSGKYRTYSDIEGKKYLSVHSYEDNYENLNVDLYNYPTYDLTFKFDLKTGGSAERTYTLNMPQIKELLLLDTTEEMANLRADALMEIIDNSYYNQYGKFIREYHLNYCQYLGTTNTEDQELSKDEAEEFVESYRQDWASATEEDFLTSRVVCYIGNMVPIRECFEQTLSFMNDHGITFSQSNYITNTTAVLYAPSYYTCWGREDITATFGFISANENKARIIGSDQIRELLKYASSAYYEENPCYVMELFGTYYAIPSQYSDIAERIYNDSRSQINGYTFDKFINDIISMGAYEYNYSYVDGNGQSLEEFQWIEDYLFTSTADLSEMDEIARKQYMEKFELLKMFFGYSSAEDYIFNSPNGSDLTENEIRRMYRKYCESFPEISSHSETFRNLADQRDNDDDYKLETGHVYYD